MTFYHGPYDSAIQSSQSQLTGEKPETPPAYNEGKPLDILMEVLSGIPQDAVFADLGAALTAAATGQDLSELMSAGKAPPEEGGGGGGIAPIGVAPTGSVPPTVTTTESIAKVKRTMSEMSAPVLNSQAVLEGAINPNTMFHIGSVLTSGIVSIIGELLSIGQIDELLQPLLTFLDLTDAPSVFNGVRSIRLDNQVFAPYRYYVNEQNPILIPPYSDLIRLRVREDRFGSPILNQDEFVQQMKYSGYAEWWSNALWDAHFILPSNSELFQMYNYNVISYEEMRKQLIINDIAPEWVDRIADIAKRYPTMPELRMMARRMPMPRELVERALRAQGIREEFFDSYVALFNDWDVDRIRKRKRTGVISGYRDGYLDDEEFRNIISQTDASTNETEEMLQEAQWKRFDRRMGERKKTVIKLFQKGRIVRDEAEEVLAAMGFELIDIEHWLDYAVAAMGAMVELEDISEEDIEGLEPADEREVKFAEWQELEPPMFYPFPVDEEPPA